MAISAGARLGPYEILSLVGVGGMGEVYKGRDTRLDRIVAIKLLPSELAHDSERRERFEREARAVAALNHPHVCGLHDIGDAPNPESPGTSAEPLRFLVMEYLEGQTLAERLLRGPLSMPDVWRYAIELADALDHAHRRGLVHRDLKPGNVMLTKGGAKLLDFGLSRLQPTSDLLALSTMSPGPTPLTAAGAVLGTYPYMSPEQLSGREVDVRCDIFAFGAVLYEMATGRRAFEGQTFATVIGAVLHIDPPPLSSVQPLVPSGLDRVVTRCLAKDPENRWQTTRDLVLELQWIAERGEAPARAAQPRRTGAAMSIALAVVTTMAAAGMLVYARRAPTDGGVASLAFAPPESVTLAETMAGGSVTISPDGRQLAFVAINHEGVQQLWVRPLESFDAKALPDTEGAMYPFWSPDNRFVGFFAQRKLKKIQLSGGPSQPICNAVLPRGGTWSRDGLIVFADRGGRQLSRVAAAGGPSTPIAADGLNVERYWPSFLPDGRHFVYFARPQQHGIYLAALDTPGAKLLLPDHYGAAYTPPGYLLAYTSASRGTPAGSLMAYAFDSQRLELTSEAAPVAQHVGYVSALGRAAYSLSENGRLVYERQQSSPTKLVWFDRRGRPIGDVGGSVPYSGPSLSPDDGTIVVERFDLGTQIQNLWLIDAARNIASRFTSDPNFNINFNAVWSPDGSRIAFAAAGRGLAPNLYVKAHGDAGPQLLIESSCYNSQPTDWSHDGRYIVYACLAPSTSSWDLWLLPMTGEAADRKPIPFVESGYTEHLGRVSPDGSSIAYVSDESLTNEVYVATFPTPGGTLRVSIDGGTEPRWREDGRELYYLAPDGRLMALAVRGGAAPRFDPPIELFKVRVARRSGGYSGSYAVARDGQRFVVSIATADADPAPTKIVLNWPAALPR